MNKTVAKEWLIFILCFIFGWFFAPLVLDMNLDHTRIFQFLQNPYEMYLVYSYINRTMVYWVLILTPYIAVQLVRSIIWAIKVSLKKTP